MEAEISALRVAKARDGSDKFGRLSAQTERSEVDRSKVSQSGSPTVRDFTFYLPVYLHRLPATCTAEVAHIF